MTRKIWPNIPLKNVIGHFRNDKGAGAEMRPAIISGSVTGHTPISYWPVLETDPELFAKVNSAQFPSLFESGE